MIHSSIAFKNELKHFLRSPLKIIALLLFILGALYGLQNGYELYKEQNEQISELKRKQSESANRITGFFDSGKTGPEDRPWVNITKPFWALWNTPSAVIKHPSPLLPFTTGQTEQFGYIKSVNVWSTTFDADILEEISNPERLRHGALDFSFMLLIILPILLIILLFNIGGLEKDNGIDPLLRVMVPSYKKWIYNRLLFYFTLIALAVFLLMLFYGIITGAIQNNPVKVMKLFLLFLWYMLGWFALFFIIILRARNGSSQAISMVTTWLVICMIVPGAIHQIIAVQYPLNLNLTFIDSYRQSGQDIAEMKPEYVISELYRIYPELADTKHGKDTLHYPELIQYSLSALSNELMKKSVLELEDVMTSKNQLIRNLYWINPLSFFQNSINSLAENDFESYRDFRNEIQRMIDKKNRMLVLDTWNNKTVTKAKYLEYIETFTYLIEVELF